MGALAMFWLVALLNFFYAFAAPLGGWFNWAAWLVLLFGMLHLRSLR